MNNEQDGEKADLVINVHDGKSWNNRDLKENCCKNRHKNAKKYQVNLLIFIDIKKNLQHFIQKQNLTLVFIRLVCIIALSS